MKTLMSLRTLVMAALFCAAHATSLAQGPLNPPGPPMPTMKTLVEMEPRTHITSLPYTITASGSYHLTTNLNGGGAGNGIVVQASGVTIDLRGFSILNCTVGLSAGPGVRGVTVHNGMVSGCTGTGIDLGAVNKVRLEDVIVCNNGGDGASVGSASIMTLCTAVANAGRGLALDSGGTVFRCVAQSNSASGITVTSNCQVTDNTCEQNGSGAGQAGVLTTGSGNRVEGNSCNDSAAHGFKINGAGNLVIRNNACRNAAGDYAVAMGNNYGQVLVAPGAAFVNANPWANFSCGTPPNGPCTTDASCEDNNPCTTDVCDVSTGQCTHIPIPDCSQPICGNGIVEAGELCDDGNMVNGDGCDSNCTPTACGNGIVTAGEQCDDGNLINGDGCSATCQIQCETAAQCDDGNPCTTDYCMGGACGHNPIPNCGQSVCGNGMLEPGEQCDDGNQANGDGCNVLCQIECTNSMQCNDGNPCTTDYCMGNVCGHTPVPNCGQPICGNGIVDMGEQCDDGNAVNGDGCDNNCRPTACGNGIVTGTEQCDDGNTMSGDGCSATCQIENLPCMNGQVQACYTGPGGTAGIGICHAGTQTCSMGTWGPCTGQVTPALEICDGLDNDCDGQTDEGLGTISCGVGACQRTVAACLGGTPQTCYPGMPVAEICNNGIDDNCNGSVDEGCVVAVCGNGIVEPGETCDDGNLVNGDGCSAVCSVQPGFTCVGTPSVCTSTCGDGITAGAESCDDANQNNGDGCSATCQVEPGFTCSGSPSACTPVNHLLTTARAGTGTGTITSAPAGINCGADCTEAYSHNTVVTLTAAPNVNSTFAGWSGGGCSGTGTCTVTMSAATTVTATFSLNTYQLTVARAGNGTGTVTSTPSGISCGADCTEAYLANTLVTLTATPSGGSTFAGWSGACSGTGTCNVTMNSARSVTATFTSP